MGCSQPHPHGQIWAENDIPNEPRKELEQQKKYFNRRNRQMLVEYVERELDKKERIIYTNPGFTVLVPYWAVWPFEAMILPNSQIGSIDILDSQQITYLADAFSTVTRTFDAIFNTSFPYSMGISQAPTDGREHNYQTMHISFKPPLLRSADVKKFMVGYEMFAQPQRDITPEKAVEIMLQAKERITK